LRPGTGGPSLASRGAPADPWRAERRRGKLPVAAADVFVATPGPGGAETRRMGATPDQPSPGLRGRDGPDSRGPRRGWRSVAPPSSSLDTESTSSAPSAAGESNFGSSAGSSSSGPPAGRGRSVDRHTIVREALHAFKREQQEDAVVDPRFEHLLRKGTYRLARRGGRLHVSRGQSLRTVRGDVRALMQTSKVYGAETPLGLIDFLRRIRTAASGADLNEGTAVTLLQYFVSPVVLGTLHRVEEEHPDRPLSYVAALRALIAEHLDGDDLVKHLHALMQATQEKWEDEHKFAARLLDGNRALGSVLAETELEPVLLKGVNREIRQHGRDYNTRGRSFAKLRTHLAKMGVATRAARGVKLAAMPRLMAAA